MLARALASLVVVVLAVGCAACDRGSKSSSAEAGAGAAAPSLAPAVTLDLPRVARADEVLVFFTVTLTADGRTFVDGKPAADDDAIGPLARAAAAKEPDVRAYIQAEAAVPHGRVIRVLDLLKQGGISKVAFAVQPPPTPR